MKSLTWLLESILDESSTLCDTDTHLDKLTISRRIKAEGLSFLTITLPNFCRDFEKSLDDGSVDSKCFPGFRKHLALPAFLRGLTSRIFDPKSGSLLQDPCLESIRAIRQVCLMHKKVLIPCSKERNEKALQTFVEVENELRDNFVHMNAADLADFIRVSGILWSSLGSRMTSDIEDGNLIPKHGPGATAEKIHGNQKFRIRRWHSRLDPYFPLDQYCIPNMDAEAWQEIVDDVELVDPAQEDPVRITLVPKTLKAPRIIAIEPVCNQYTQQALLRPLVSYLEGTGASAGHINFRDQQVNRDLALRSSRDGSYATLDMSEASDRVHKDIVALMLNSAPLFRDAVMACRSTSALMPDGSVIPLSKFASMGSGLCFPMESMVFFTICILSRLRTLRLSPTSRNINKVSRDVFVYGDDLIIPADEVSAIANTLELFMLKVNYNKTFGTGMFRESCGMDAYDGCDVTPCYVRREQPRNRQSVAEIVSRVSLANQLYLKGWWGSASRVRAEVEGIIGPLPTVQDTSPGLGWVTVKDGYTITRWDRELHCFKVKTWVARIPKVADALDGAAALLKCLLKVGDQPTFEGHLEHTVRPDHATLKRRWVLPY